jgi:hypothetical protein
MAVNKNFVVKNGLEVNDDLILANATDSMVGIGTSVPYYTLHTQGGIGATTLWVAGVSTFTSDVSVAGVTTLASGGGIVTTGGDLYVAGDLSVLGDVTYDEVVGRNLNITGVGTILNVVVGSGLSVTGISTLTGPVGMETGLTVAGVTTLASAGGITTTGGDLYVGGDLFVLDDVVYDEVTGRNLNITGVATIAQANITTVNVSSASTFVGVSTFTNVWVGGGLTVAGNLDVTGDITYDEVTGRNLNITGVGTVTRLNTTNLVGTISTITRLNTTDIVSTAGTITTGTINQLTNTDFVGTSATITRLNSTSFVGTAGTITTGTITYLTSTHLTGTIGTITRFNATDAVVSGVLTATTFIGAAQVGVSSEGTYLGTGASVINFASSTGTAWTVEPAGTSGIATVTVTPGASIGLAIALGG